MKILALLPLLAITACNDSTSENNRPVVLSGYHLSQNIVDNHLYAGDNFEVNFTAEMSQELRDSHDPLYVIRLYNGTNKNNYNLLASTSCMYGIGMGCTGIGSISCYYDGQDLSCTGEEPAALAQKKLIMQACGTLPPREEVCHNKLIELTYD